MITGKRGKNSGMRLTGIEPDVDQVNDGREKHRSNSYGFLGGGSYSIFFLNSGIWKTRFD